MNFLGGAGNALARADLREGLLSTVTVVRRRPRFEHVQPVSKLTTLGLNDLSTPGRPCRRYAGRFIAVSQGTISYTHQHP